MYIHGLHKWCHTYLPVYIGSIARGGEVEEGEGGGEEGGGAAGGEMEGGTQGDKHLGAVTSAFYWLLQMNHKGTFMK